MLELTTTTDGPAHTIVIAGELDHQTTSRLHEALTGLSLGSGDHLAIDLARLTFCDSSGLSTFLVARELTVDAGATLDLVAQPRMLTRMLRTTGLTEVFTIRDQAVR